MVFCSALATHATAKETTPEKTLASKQQLDTHNEKRKSMLQNAQRASDSMITCTQGKQVALGAHRVGVMSVGSDQALLSVVSPLADGGSYRVQMQARAGELIPVGGKLYRVVQLMHATKKRAEQDAPKAAGSSRNEVVFDSEPVAVPGVELHEKGLAIPVGATATLLGSDIELQAVTAAVATLEVWPSEFAKPQTKPELIKRHEVKTGQSLSLGSRTLPVVTVVAPQAEAGINGLVELGL